MHAIAGPADSAAVDAAVNAYYETEFLATQYIPGGYAREGAAGTRMVVWKMPNPDVNVVRIDRGRDLRQVEAFAQELSAAGLPWSIQVRGDVEPELKELGTRHGRTGTSTAPLLLWDAESLPALPAALPDGATVRRVSGKDSEAFTAALAAGFDAPHDVARLLAQPGFLDAPGITGFVLDLRGEAVATGINVIAGDYVGMFGGSVPPRHRRNGYYRALVTARLTDAAARGARHAVSMNSPTSRPLFESVGFRLAETWNHLSPAS